MGNNITKHDSQNIFFFWYLIIEFDQQKKKIIGFDNARYDMFCPKQQTN